MNKLNVDKKTIVGFDMDGVILDYADSKIKIAKKFGFDLKRHHTPFEIIKTMLPQVVLEELQKIIYSTPYVALSIPLMKGVKGVLAELDKKDIPLFLISRRKSPDIAIKTLQKHSLWPMYFNEKNSFFVKDPKDKNTQAVKLGITHFMDDELVNIEAMSKIQNKFLFDQFGIFKDGKRYVRIKSWADFKKQAFNKI